MAMITDASLASETEAEGLAFAREVLRIEAEALERVRDRLGPSIAQAADLIYRSSGSVIVTGMGKAGLVGQKLAATLASTGTRAFPLHPAEAVHGDLGRIRADDIVDRPVAERRDRGSPPADPGIAAAGGVPDRDHRTGEQLAGPGGRPLHRAGADRGGVSAGAGPLGQHDGADGRRRCAGLLVSRMRDFRAEDFALYHPGGSLGRKLTRVEDVMRTGRQLRRAHHRRDGPLGLRAAGRPAAALGRGADRGRRTHVAGDLHRQRPGPAVREAPGGRPGPPDRRGHDGRSVFDVESAPRWPSGRAHEDAQDQRAAGRGSRRPLVGLIDVTDLIGLVPADFEE